MTKEQFLAKYPDVKSEDLKQVMIEMMRTAIVRTVGKCRNCKCTELITDNHCNVCGGKQN
jgi:hypothetical protein